MKAHARFGRIRVLIASEDEYFVDTSRGVLEREGLAVDAVKLPVDVTAAAERTASDVVLLDATSAPPTIARLMWSLERLERPVGLVVVSDNPRAPRLDSFHPSPKWGSAERLVAQVREAYLSSDTKGGACLAVL